MAPEQKIVLAEVSPIERKKEFERRIASIGMTKEISKSSQPEEKSSVVPALQQDIQMAENTLKMIEELKQEEKAQEEAVSEKKSKRRSSYRQKSFKLRKPTSWLLQPIFLLAKSSLAACAEGGGGGMEVPPSQGNPEGQQGGQGGSVLSGIAQIIAAAAPMVVAAMESDKEQKVAKIETEAQITQAQLQADTQMALAQESSKASMAQAQMSKEVAQMNNEEQTKRQLITLSAQQQVRNEERALQAEKDQIQRDLEAQKIVLAQKQADEAIRLAEEKLEAQRLAATLSGQSLPAEQSSGRSTYSGNPLAAAFGTPATQSGSANTGRGFMGGNQAALVGQSSKPSNRLLASVDSTLSEVEENPTLRRFMGKKRPRAEQKRSGLKTAEGLYRYVPALAAGSFSGKSEKSLSDLGQFAADTKVSQSFAEYQTRRGSKAASHLSH